MPGRRPASAETRAATGVEPVRPAPVGAAETLAARLYSGVESLGGHAGGLYVLAPYEPVLELVAQVGWPRDLARPWLRISVSAPLPVADALRHRSRVWVGGEEEMACHYARLVVALPYPVCMAAWPLLGSSGALGAVFVAWPPAHPGRLSPEECRTLDGLARELADELERLNRAGTPLHGADELVVLTEPPGREQPPDLLAGMADRLPEGLCALDLDGRLTFISSGAARLLGEPAARLVGARPWAALPWLADPVYEDRYRAAVVSRDPTSFVALRPPDRWLCFHLYPGPSGLTLRIQPARVAGGDAPEPVPAATAATPTRTGALYQVLHLASALTEAAGVQDVVDIVADQLVPSFGGQAIALLTAEGGRMRVVADRGFEPGLMKRVDGTPLTAFTPGARSLVTAVPSFFGSREELERIYPATRGYWGDVAAWAFLPLVASGRTVGTCVVGFTRPHRFTVEERAVLTSLGGLVAQALERAHLYDAKLALAHGLQESLLPHALPRVPGLSAAVRYLPGTEGMEIGGDFYDLIRLGPQSLGAVIGDVQGHNVTAAALMGQVRTAVHAYATAGADPGEVLARTNRLLADLDPGLFASCLYLRIDLRRDEALLAIAGHTQPLVRDPQGRARVLEAPSGLLLGVEPAADYPLTRLPLPRGSVVALYTDGLVEAPGTDLGEAVADLAGRLGGAGDRPLEDLADLLVHGAEEAGRRTDDLALLLLRLEP